MNIKHFCFSTIYVFVFLLFFSCASVPQEVPDWVEDYTVVYPDSTYIAQLARVEKGDAVQVKNRAAVQLAEYIRAEVQSEKTTEYQMTQSADGAVSEQLDIVSNSSVSTDLTMNYLEYTEPWYSKASKTWFCVAYIEREKAYEAYKPTIQDGRDKFMALYDKAEQESDYIQKCVFYKSAYNSGSDFKSSYDFGILLNKNAVKEDYAADRELLNSIPAKVKEIISKCTMKLNVTGDYGNDNYSAILDVFSGMGFSVQKESSIYTVDAEIDPNDSVYKMKTKETHTIYPSINIRIRNKDGKTVYSFSFKTEQKTTNFTLENAQRDAYPAFATEMSKALEIDFKEKTGVSDMNVKF